MTDTPSILTGAVAADVASAPFPHLLRLGCLGPDAFERLAGAFPKPSFPAGTPQNFLALLDPFAAGVDAALTETWRRFAAHHVSAAFWREMVAVLGPALRRTHPGLEARLGAPLEAVATAPVGAASDAPVRLGVQFGFNTPVTTPSSVRGVHIDKARRLVSALLYMPEPGDDAGGDLVLYRFRDARRFDGVTAALADVEPVTRVGYAANTLIMFVNSVESLHGVLPRRPTERARRYVNFYVDVALDSDLVDASPFQATAAG